MNKSMSKVFILFGLVLLVFGFVYAGGYHLASEILPGTFSVGDFVFDGDLSVNGEIQGFGVVPVGTIVAWHKSLSGTPSLPDGWVECNGQTLSDSNSVYDGRVIPDLNSEVYAGNRGYYLRGGSVSGSFSSSSRLIGNGNKYDFHDSTNTYYGVGYGELVDGEDGNTLTYSETDNQLGSNEFKVAAMTVVWIMRVK